MENLFSCKCLFMPNHFNVNGMLFLKVWDSNEVIQCLRKSAHFFFPMAWLIESLPSNSNILDAVIGTNQV